MDKEILKELRSLAGDENVFENEIMAPRMSMRVGGPADCLVSITSVSKLKALVKFLAERGVPYYVLGNGTNVIIRDEGYRGVILNIKEGMCDVSVAGNKVRAQAGVSLSDLAGIICGASLKGFEFASGIPGSLGGAVTMNAGAYDGEMKNVISEVYAVDKEGREVTFKPEEAEFSYRHSIFSGGDYIITGAELTFEKGDKETIRKLMDELNGRRAQKQPLDLPSCGSTFKRPEGHYAGKLIMDSGLSGARVGGASVSKKHCGFVVNDRGGSAADVLGVIEMVKATVKEKTGIELECEVRVL